MAKHGEMAVKENYIAWCPCEPSTMAGHERLHTAGLLCFLPETLFERPLVLWRERVLGVAFRPVVLCEDAVALAVEDDERVDAVEGQVHDGVARTEFETKGVPCFGVRRRFVQGPAHLDLAHRNFKKSVVALLQARFLAPCIDTPAPAMLPRQRWVASDSQTSLALGRRICIAKKVQQDRVEFFFSLLTEAGKRAGEDAMKWYESFLSLISFGLTSFQVAYGVHRLETV